MSGLVVWYVPYSGQQNENQYEMSTQQSLSNFANQLISGNVQNGSTISETVPLGIQGIFLSSSSQTSLSYENNFNISVHYNVSVGVSYSGNTPPNLVQNRIISNISVGTNPNGVAVDTVNNLIFVTNSNYSTNNPGNIEVLSGSTNQPIREINLDGIPTGIAFDSKNNLIFVTEGNNSSFNSGFVQVIGGNSLNVVKTLDYSSMPYDITYVPYLNEMMFTIVYPETIGYGGSVVSLNATDYAQSGYIQLAPPGSNTLPSSISYDPANGYVYVALGTSIAIINPILDMNISQIQVNTPWSLAFDTSNGFIFGTSSYLSSDNTPTCYDSNGSNTSPAFYVINGTNNKIVTGIPSLSTSPFLLTPTAITFDSANHFLYMTDFSNSTVWIINGQNGTFLKPVEGYPSNAGPGNGPNAIAYDPLNGEIYVPNWNYGTVTVISGDTVLSQSSNAFGTSFRLVNTLNGSGQITASANTPFIPQRTISLQDGYVVVDYTDQSFAQSLGGNPLTLSHNLGLVSLAFNILNLKGQYFSVSQTGNFLLSAKVNALLTQTIQSGERLIFSTGGVQYTANVTDIILNDFSMTINSSYVPLWNYTFYKEYNNTQAIFNPAPNGGSWQFNGLPINVRVSQDSMTISTIVQSTSSTPLLLSSFDLNYLDLFVNY
jgi:DNA-binding beta-propeller fold protein YncE